MQRRLLVGSGIGLGLALASVLVSRLPASHDTVRMVDGRTPAQASASTGYIGSLKGGTSAVELAPMTERQAAAQRRYLGGAEHDGGVADTARPRDG